MAKSLVSAIISRNSRENRKFNVFLFHNALAASESHAALARNFSAASVNAAGAKLTPTEVSTRLRRHEFTTGEGEHIFGVAGPVKAVDINKLRSNVPIEDAHAEGVADLGDRKAILFSVIDGHGGPTCGQVVSRRILDYVSAGLMSPALLDSRIEAVRRLQEEDDGSGASGNGHSCVTYVREPVRLVHRFERLYLDSYLAHLVSLKARMEESSGGGGGGEEKTIADILVDAFTALDGDLAKESIDACEDPDPEFRRIMTSIAASGAVAAVALVDGADLYVASTGDCSVVLGSISENDTWIAKKLTTEHSTENPKEMKRIQDEHPTEKMRDIIRGERLLGSLAPLRAFGDFKFKWPGELIDRVLGPNMQMPNYKTPPYLTVVPEITHHKLTTRDKFMVLATDGLWDMMTPMQVIRLVGEHMSGKVVLKPLVLGQTERNKTLRDIDFILKSRQAAMKVKPEDENSATHLLRCALGGTAYGVDHGRLSQMLTLPQDMVRSFRDDITVVVPFFDSEFLGKN